MDPNQKVIHSVIEKFVEESQKDVGYHSSWEESLGLRARDLISLVGGGGKTTLMFRLAKELSLAGKRVVTTTTTKILEPASGDTSSLLVDPDEESIKDFLLHHLEQSSPITVAAERLGGGKLKGIAPDFVDDLWQSGNVDYLIVEADGAAGRPLKAPREKEPVIPSKTSLVIAILGMDGMGRELSDEAVFQVERVSRLTGIAAGETMTGEALAVLVIHPEGIFKGAPTSARVVAFLNKVDIPNGVKKAREVAQRILEKRHRQIERVVLGQLKNDPPVAEVIFPSHQNR